MRMPAKSTWLPAEITELRTTVSIRDAAAVAATEKYICELSGTSVSSVNNALSPECLKTIVKGDVVVLWLDKFG